MKKHLGTTLQEARKDRGLDQHELADLLGVTESMVSKVENGHRNLRATEYLTLGLIFHDWFDMETNDLVSELTAELVARLKEFMERTDFRPVEHYKEQWLKKLLTNLDRGVGEIA